MRITAVTAMTIAVERAYQLGGRAAESDLLPGGEYLYFAPFPELYGRCTQAMLVKVETDTGLVGWGESQSPVGPQVTQTIVQRVLAPIVLGQDPRDFGVHFASMYDSLRVRGQVGGFQLDAIAAVDTALWDLAGKAHGTSVSHLLGGRFRDRLPCYISGLLGSTLEDRATEARKWVDQGFVGVKPFLGHGLSNDIAEITALRTSMGDDARLFADAMWRYDGPTAVRLGRLLEAHGVDFFEAPMLPEDIAGHRALASALDIPIAVGEPLRTTHQFLPWLREHALDVCQPDPMRNGVSETAKIAALADVFNVPVALHNGAVTVVGMAATWHLAASIPNFLVQELEPQMLEMFNGWLTSPLRVEDGHAVVPSGTGLGIEIDEERLAEHVTDAVTVRLDA